MRSLKLLTLSLVVLAGAFGCSAASDDDGTDPNAVSEDQLILGHGSVDHAAIVESTTMQLIDNAVVDFPEVLDPYNQSDPFNISPAKFRAAYLKNIAKFDNEDGKADWTPEQTTAWATRMSTGNYQVVDLSKPCNFDDPHSYLEIERAQLTGKDHTTCGGRHPNEDAMDVTLNFLIRGPSASDQDEGAIRDGVSQATHKATRAFPYLAEHNSL